MNREELTRAIRDIYRDTLIKEKERLLTGELSVTSSQLFLMEKKIKETSEKIDHISPEVHNKIFSKFNDLMNELKDEVKKQSPTIGYDEFEEECKKNATKYSSAVQRFTDAGGKGFYDIGMTISVMFDKDISKVTRIIDQFKAKGNDIEIVHKKIQKNDSFSRFYTAGEFSVIMPSSLYDKFNEKINEVITKDAIYETDKFIKKRQYFISPVINDTEKHNLDNVKNVIKYFEDKEKSWAVEHGFSSLGYARFELSDRTTLQQITTEMLSHVTLYSKSKNEHVNGIMPTVYHYSNDEIENCKIDVSKFENGIKTLNIVDDLTRYDYLKSKPKNELIMDNKKHKNTNKNKMR